MCVRILLFKQKTAYEMRISDWSSDVCSSDLSILQADLRSVIGRPLETVDGMLEFIQIVRQAFAQHAAVGSERLHWQQQFEITLAAAADSGEVPQPLTLLARGTHLRVDGRGNGYLVVFDDKIGRAHV